MIKDNTTGTEFPVRGKSSTIRRCAPNARQPLAQSHRPGIVGRTRYVSRLLLTAQYRRARSCHRLLVMAGEHDRGHH